jgi:hypothetical protein
MKLKETIMIAVGALAFLLITGIAKSDEKTTTPKEFVTAVSEVPSKVGNHFKNEWQDIKEYQAKSWAETKQRWPWNVILKGSNDE